MAPGGISAKCRAVLLGVMSVFLCVSTVSAEYLIVGNSDTVEVDGYIQSPVDGSYLSFQLLPGEVRIYDVAPGSVDGTNGFVEEMEGDGLTRDFGAWPLSTGQVCETQFYLDYGSLAVGNQFDTLQTHAMPEQFYVYEVGLWLTFAVGLLVGWVILSPLESA